MIWLRRALSGLVAILAFGMALGCCTGAVLAQGGRFNVNLDILTHFAPFWLIGGLVAPLLVLPLAPGVLRSMTFGLGAVAALAAATLIAPEYLRPKSPWAPQDSPHQLKLIQYNAWDFRGQSPSVDWIAAEDPDVIIVEEATPALRDALLTTRPYYVTCAACEVMIFSKQAPLTSHIERPKRWWPWAPTVRASFPAPGGAYDVVGVHYTWPTTGTQAAQGRILAKVLKQFPPDRLILAGDFNSTPWSFTRRREDAAFGIERRTRGLLSWPTPNGEVFGLSLPIAFLAIDHVYAGADWRTVDVQRGPALNSDHYPVVVTLALKPEG